MVVEALREELGREDGPTIVSAQLGEVNTGACDDLNAIADATSGPERGCTSTARLASGHLRPRPYGTSPPVWSVPIRGRLTRTSG